MQILSMIFGIVFGQAIDFFEDKFSRYGVKLQRSIYKFQNRFLLSLALVLFLGASFSAFLTQLGINSDLAEGFRWTTSLTLYLISLVSCLLGLIWINRIKIPVVINEEEPDLSELADILQDLASKPRAAPRRRRKRKP